MEKILVFGFIIRFLIGFKFRKDYMELGQGFLEKYSQFLNGTSFLLCMLAVNINKNYELPMIFGWGCLAIVIAVFVITAKAAKRVQVRIDDYEKENGIQ